MNQFLNQVWYLLGYLFHVFVYVCILKLTNIFMKRTILFLSLISATLIAQSQVVKLSGPRVGATVVTPGSASDFIQNGLMPGDDGWNSSTTALVSQYGWQLETRYAEGEAIIGLVEWVFLVGGLEKGLFLPSVSSLFGVRFQDGFEVGVGPNLSLTGAGMVLALGYNISTPNINIPINISFVPGKSETYDEYFWNNIGEDFVVSTDYNTGSRISLTFGFNIVK